MVEMKILRARKIGTTAGYQFTGTKDHCFANRQDWNAWMATPVIKPDKKDLKTWKLKRSDNTLSRKTGGKRIAHKFCEESVKGSWPCRLHRRCCVDEHRVAWSRKSQVEEHRGGLPPRTSPHPPTTHYLGPSTAAVFVRFFSTSTRCVC